MIGLCAPIWQALIGLIAAGVTQGRFAPIDPACAALTAEGAAATAVAASALANRAGVLAQTVRRAEAEAAVAQQDLARSRTLFECGLVAQARLDADLAAAGAANAAVAQARAEQAAAVTDAGGAGASARLARRRVQDMRVSVPNNGAIHWVYHCAGEVVAPGVPLAGGARSRVEGRGPWRRHGRHHALVDYPCGVFNIGVVAVPSHAGLGHIQQFDVCLQSNGPALRPPAGASLRYARHVSGRSSRLPRPKRSSDRVKEQRCGDGLDFQQHVIKSLISRPSTPP